MVRLYKFRFVEAASTDFDAGYTYLNAAHQTLRCLVGGFQRSLWTTTYTGPLRVPLIAAEAIYPPKVRVACKTDSTIKQKIANNIIQLLSIKIITNDSNRHFVLQKCLKSVMKSIQKISLRCLWVIA